MIPAGVDYLKQIATAAAALVGCGYIYGATGWVCTPARVEQQATQYPQYADLIRKYGLGKWAGKPCYDCAQLTRTAARVAGISIPSGATSQWKADIWEEKGSIGALPKETAGLLLYRESGGSMQHTGVCIGDGTFVDARGHAYGVLQSPMGSYAWTHWGRLKPPKTEENGGGTMQEVVGQKAVVTAASGSTVNLRKAPDPKGDLLAKVPVGSTVDVLEVGSEWCTVSALGKHGYMMREFLSLEGANEGPDDVDEQQSPPQDTAAFLARFEAIEARLSALERSGAM